MDTLKGEQLLDVLIAANLLKEASDGVEFAYKWLRRALAGTSTDSAARKVILGLTGNIAMGKSTVLRMLAELGAQVIDADQLIHRLREPGAPGYKPVIEALGQEIVLPDGRIDTRMLAQKAFENPGVLTQMEAIFRPLVVVEILRMIQESASAVIVVEAIKLLEGGLKGQVDQVWVVEASRETQVRRLIEERGLSYEQAVARIDRQNPQAEKLAQADVIIRNDGDLAETRRQVLEAWPDVMAILAQDGEVPSPLVETFVSAALESSVSSISPEQAIAGLRKLAHQEMTGPLSLNQAVELLNEVQ